MEKRRHMRIDMNSLTVDASDGNGFFQGIVSDASRFGLCLSDLPKKIMSNVSHLTVVVSGQGHHFKMQAKPKWSTNDSAMKSFGVEILDPPLSWIKFIKNFEPKLEVDVWAAVAAR